MRGWPGGGGGGGGCKGVKGARGSRGAEPHTTPTPPRAHPAPPTNEVHALRVRVRLFIGVVQQPAQVEDPLIPHRLPRVALHDARIGAQHLIVEVVEGVPKGWLGGGGVVVVVANDGLLEGKEHEGVAVGCVGGEGGWDGGGERPRGGGSRTLPPFERRVHATYLHPCRQLAATHQSASQCGSATRTSVHTYTQP